jgi:hypothetical protein
LVQTGQLASVVKFEGGEGSPRHGYAQRMLMHEIALFEQLYLFGLDSPAVVAGSILPIPQQERIRDLFLRLGRRLGCPVEPLLPQLERRYEPLTTDSEVERGFRQSVLKSRIAEIERILASLDSLTSLPSTV